MPNSYTWSDKGRYKPVLFVGGCNYTNTDRPGSCLTVA